ncbi:hypothetical protein YPPY66_2468, partial [Yersinia pestis PY-66]
MNNSKNRLSN